MSDKEKTHFVIRGGESISSDDHRANLALALRLENIGVLLGAGASLDSGGKTMKGIWESIPKATKEKLKAQKFIEDEKATPNVEELLTRLQLAQVESKRQGATTEKEISDHLEVVNRAVIHAAILADELWGDRSLIEASNKLDAYRRLVVRMQGSRQPGQAAPWLFTLNYDLAIEWTVESLGIHLVNGFTGLHNRLFQPNAFDLSLQNTKAAGEARFGSYNLNLVKMHGSLNWSLNESKEAVEVPCSSIRKGVLAYATGKKPSQGEEYEPLLIQPTAAKYLDTVGFVYGELTRRFTEFLARPNTMLVVSGYSFADKHINRLLASGLLNPTLQLVIYLPFWLDRSQPIGNTFLDQLRALELPRIVFCGGGEGAYFAQMTRDLPDPAMVDELSPDAKRMLSSLAKGIVAVRKKDE